MYDDACGTTWAHDIAPSQPLTWNNKSVAPAAGAPSHENAIKEGYLEVKKRDAGRGDVDQALNAFCVLTARELRLYGDKKDKKLRGSVSLACCQVKQRGDCHQERCCFHLVARDKMSHEFTAASVKDADSWVEAIQKMTGETSTRACGTARPTRRTNSPSAGATSSTSTTRSGSGGWASSTAKWASCRGRSSPRRTRCDERATRERRHVLMEIHDHQQSRPQEPGETHPLCTPPQARGPGRNP
ncbi:unnamed protein product [Lampetra planeri]